jgi:hypothetical protein
MNEQIKSEQEALEKERMRLGYIGAPAILMLGLALNAKFNGGGEPLLSVLDNEAVVMGMLVIGGAILVYTQMRHFKILKRLHEMKKNQDT